jgi:hypothetical protein
MLEIIKGDVSTLTPAQRELVGIFIEHLRSLPALERADWDKSCARNYDRNTTYRPIYDILLAYFDRRTHRGLLPYAGAELWAVLKQEEKDRFHNLMENAAPPEDPRIKRKLTLLEVARSKRSALKFIEYYERNRREAGLGPDPDLKSIRGPVGIEVAAAATWGEKA